MKFRRRGKTKVLKDLEPFRSIAGDSLKMERVRFSLISYEKGTAISDFFISSPFNPDSG
jgi:hypothetical protein